MPPLVVREEPASPPLTTHAVRAAYATLGKGAHPTYPTKTATASPSPRTVTTRTPAWGERRVGRATTNVAGRVAAPNAVPAAHGGSVKRPAHVLRGRRDPRAAETAALARTSAPMARSAWAAAWARGHVHRARRKPAILAASAAYSNEVALPLADGAGGIVSSHPRGVGCGDGIQPADGAVTRCRTTRRRTLLPNPW